LKNATNGAAISTVRLNPGDTITVIISLTYKIDDDNTIRNDPFCAAGNKLEILNKTTLIDMS